MKSLAGENAADAIVELDNAVSPSQSLSLSMEGLSDEGVLAARVRSRPYSRMYRRGAVKTTRPKKTKVHRQTQLLGCHGNPTVWQIRKSAAEESEAAVSEAWLDTSLSN